jgi:hypothetical protein
MKKSRDDLLSLLDDATVALSEILLRHRSLEESLLATKAISASHDRIEKRRAEIEKERTKIRKARETIRRRRDLEKIRKDHEKDEVSETVKYGLMVPVRDGNGRTIGWLQAVGKDRVNVFDRWGKIVARELGSTTFDHRGRVVGRGVNQGLRVLGQSLEERASSHLSLRWES